MFTLDTVVPWGRSFDEYRRMFALGDAERRLRILGCADGPASFNAEATQQGLHVVSCDPIYAFTAPEIRARIHATFDEVLGQTRANAHEFVWREDTVASIDTLAGIRTRAMDSFLADFDAGRAGGRYVAGELPALPFGDQTFDLALCSHFLFLYSAQLTAAFHLGAIRGLARVAREVRVFPLLALGSVPSPHVQPVVDAMQDDGFDAAIEEVPYEFQRGGNRMMRIRRRY